jgi:hypothetical protein
LHASPGRISPKPMLRGAVFHSRILAKHKKTVSRHGKRFLERFADFPVSYAGITQFRFKGY